MADLHELLAAEAGREQPVSPPPFEELLRARRSRDRRNRIAAGSMLMSAVLAAGVAPTLLGGPSATTRVAESSGQDATVTGVLRMPGGPVGAYQSGVSGVVVFRSSRGHEIKTTAGVDGKFSISVPPGSYTVTGTTSQYGDSRGSCHATGPVVVSASGLADVVVACQVGSPAKSPPTPQPGSVTASITLPTTTMRAGTSVTAKVTVENNSGTPIHLVGCGSIYRVLLIGGGQHPTPSWPLCAMQITIPTGQSTYIVRVAATYSECSPNGGEGMPTCPADGSLPPLRLGRYAATTFSVNPELPVPAPTSVTVTP